MALQFSRGRAITQVNSARNSVVRNFCACATRGAQISMRVCTRERATLIEGRKFSGCMSFGCSSEFEHFTALMTIHNLIEPSRHLTCELMFSSWAASNFTVAEPMTTVGITITELFTGCGKDSIWPGNRQYFLPTTFIDNSVLRR
jgi:hypothetical protein